MKNEALRLMRQKVIDEIMFLEEELLEIMKARGIDPKGLKPATEEDLQKETTERLIEWQRNLLLIIHDHIKS